MPGRKLLPGLSALNDSVLIGGCQRSGTRIVYRLVSESGGLACHTASDDPELDGANALAFDKVPDRSLRWCFQTTYLNDRYNEYQEHQNYHLIWLIRRPEAVVRSMLFHWYRPGLNRLFNHCGRHHVRTVAARHAPASMIPPLIRACSSYNAKCEQLEMLQAILPADRLTVIDYDRLIAAPVETLSRLSLRAGFSFNAASGDLIQSPKPQDGSVRRLSHRQLRSVRKSCAAWYDRTQLLVTDQP